MKCSTQNQKQGWYTELMVFCRCTLLAESDFAASVLYVSLGCSFKSILSLMSFEANKKETIKPLIFQCYIKTLTIKEASMERMKRIGV